MWGIYLCRILVIHRSLFVILPYPKLNHPISWSRIILDCSRMILSYINVIVFSWRILVSRACQCSLSEQRTVPHPREFASGKYYKMPSIQNSRVLCVKLRDEVQSWTQGSVDLKPRSLDLQCIAPVCQLSRQRKHGKCAFPIAVIPLACQSIIHKNASVPTEANST